jgi:hypothetical protein
MKMAGIAGWQFQNRGDEFVLLIVRNFSEPNFLGKKAFCL